MARPVREYPTARSHQEGTEKPERDPQQEDQSDSTRCKDIADYDPNVQYVGSESKVELVTQGEREVEQSIQTWKFSMMGPSARE